jgi:hypothetical protein
MPILGETAMQALAEPSPNGVVPSLVSFYAWTSAVSFGLAVADSGYAALLRSAVEPAVAAGLFARMANFLLLTSAVTLLAAALALVGAWAARAARGLVIASVALASAGLWAPLALSDAWIGDFGPALRLAIAGGASALAMLALRQAQRAP